MPERAGSLREAAREAGVDVLVYEGGEGLRFDEFAIKAGVDGIAGVMLKMRHARAARRRRARSCRRAGDARPSCQRLELGAARRTAASSARRSASATPSARARSSARWPIPTTNAAVEIRAPRRGIIVGAHDAADRQHGRCAVSHRLVEGVFRPAPGPRRGAGAWRRPAHGRGRVI